jgi:hypothetical protein
MPVYGHIHKVLYDRRVGKGTVITIKGICREGDAYKTVGDTSDSISPHKKDGEASVLLLFFFFSSPSLSDIILLAERRSKELERKEWRAVGRR